MHMMRQGRHNARPRASISTIFLGCLMMSALLYIFYFRLRELYYDHIAFEDRCESELSNVKYQLDSVLEYKEKVDYTMNTLKKECKLQKEKIQEFFDNFILIKHHLEFCEMQTEDLKIECKDLQQKLHQTKEELTACKNTPD